MFRVLGLVWIMCFVLFFVCVKSEKCDVVCINMLKKKKKKKKLKSFEFLCCLMTLGLSQDIQRHIQHLYSQR